jgi:hypothetical protein
MFNTERNPSNLIWIIPAKGERLIEEAAFESKGKWPLYIFVKRVSILPSVYMDPKDFRRCIDACNDCAVACNECMTACLREYDVRNLTRCISLTRECALICATNAALLSALGENALLLCSACATICGECASACESKSEFSHCRSCAEECRRCAEECLEMIELEILK